MRKERSREHEPRVSINSEYQLDLAHLSKLYLVVVHLEKPALDQAGAFTLYELVEELASTFREGGFELIFRERLLQLGYSDSDDYTELTWICTETEYYRVGANRLRRPISCVASPTSNIKLI